MPFFYSLLTFLWRLMKSFFNDTIKLNQPLEETNVTHTEGFNYLLMACRQMSISDRPSPINTELSNDEIRKYINY